MTFEQAATDGYQFGMEWFATGRQRHDLPEGHGAKIREQYEMGEIAWWSGFDRAAWWCGQTTRSATL